jgi:CubicO group peptidase (beta-lactamase class C family)
MSNHSTPLGGTCGARFDPPRELFAAKLESDEDLGASLAVNIEGKMVVDLWGGWADEARTVPRAEDTITCVFSTTKTMTSLAALVQVDRSELDLDANVAVYWPEFAARARRGSRSAGSCRTPRASRAGTMRSQWRTCTTLTGRPLCWPRRRPSGSPGRPRATTR